MSALPSNSGINPSALDVRFVPIDYITADLLDDLVGAGEQRERHAEAEREFDAGRKSAIKPYENIGLSTFVSAYQRPSSKREKLAQAGTGERLERVCDIEAMKQIKKDMRVPVDRAKSDVAETPVHKAHTVTASGGAYRSKGKWYRLSFVCSGTPDHTRVTSFSYKTGAEIPESKWEDLGLWR